MSNPANPSRVVVTGIGLISPLGSSLSEFATSLAQGKSGVRENPAYSASDLPLRIAGLATQFTGAIDDFGDLPKDRKKAIRKGLKVMCRETQMAVAAAQLALADAGRADGGHEPERAGVVLGSDYMLSMPQDYELSMQKCSDAGDGFDYVRWGGDGLDDMQPLWMLKYLPNMPASHIAIYNDFRGPNNSLTMREASGLMALGEAYRIIARGEADQMVAGATGTRVLPMQAIHAIQTEPLADLSGDPAAACRPFDKARTGMVAGEGAGMVVLESLASAEARGARIYGEVTGFGASQVCDQDLSGRNDVALANACQAALREAGIGPTDVGHVNAHGLATVEADAAEAAAIASVFGPVDTQPPVIAPKANIGNLGAGGGTVELAVSLLTLAGGTELEGVLPPVLNFTEPDPAAHVNAVSGGAVEPGDSFVTLSTTPQGQAAAVCIGRIG